MLNYLCKPSLAIDLLERQNINLVSMFNTLDNDINFNRVDNELVLEITTN